MKEGQTVFVVHRSQNVLEGVLGEKTTTNGFYTRWGPGHMVYFRNGAETVNSHAYNDEDIYCTRAEAKQEISMRGLRWPRLRGAA